MKLAQKLGLPASTVKKIHSQEITNPTLATLVPIAKYFSMPLEYFLDDDYHCDIPLLDLDQVIEFSNVISDKYITTMHSCSRESFALRIADETKFSKNSFIIVDKACKPVIGDYVVMIDKGNVVITQFKTEDTIILGVIIEYHRKLVIKPLIKE